MEEIIVEPSVELVESMRSVGYSLDAAIADLVDNSIDAEATVVQVDIDIVECHHIAILDNGKGMDEATAIEALRFAGTADAEYSPNRLGRFGLGLKTASLSQGRSVTVVSKIKNSIVSFRWDIDRIKETGRWSLQKLSPSDLSGLPMVGELITQESGTLVIWSKLDLLLGDAADRGEHLSHMIPGLLDHLSFTFHRFIERRNSPIRIQVNGNVVKPLDPFLRGNPRTQMSPKETLRVKGVNVEFTAFTLPHVSGLSVEDKLRPDLQENMRDYQGFYLYRNQRLLSRGHWFGLASMSEISKQTRILVDIPSALDDLWQIDIKKSRAEPPASFKIHLKKMIDPLLSKGKRVHTFRGRKVSESEISHMWSKFKDRQGFRYEVNIENPVIQAALSGLDTVQTEVIFSIFQSLAAQFPLLDAYQELASNQTPAVSELSHDEIRARLIEIRNADFLGDDMEKLVWLLQHSEPFNQVTNLPELISEIWKARNGTI